jgi:hypothetical protein
VSMLRAFPGMTIRKIVCELNLINLWAVGEYLGLLDRVMETEKTEYKPGQGGFR